MAQRIEDYALIGDRHGAGLVGRDGSLDWLCLPRFDAGACCAALLGGPAHGRWTLGLADGAGPGAERAYRPGTQVLDTRFTTATGRATLTDALLFDPTSGLSHVVRVVRGDAGRVDFGLRLAPRFDYGAVSPLVAILADGRATATAGPDRLTLATDVAVQVDGADLVARFAVAAGEERAFVLTWTPAHAVPPVVAARAFAHALLDAASRDGAGWLAGLRLDGVAPAHRDLVTRSLLTLRALTHADTGGVVAAPTTSLPETLGGARNWDYRYCWLRDASLTLGPLLAAGSLAETRAWRDWLVRAVAGAPEDLQIMYGLAGERRLAEYELPWLPGYEASVPVRVGNGAAGQLQLDVFGEVLDLLYRARRAGLPHDAGAWALEVALVAHLETVWREPDEGMWEVRGGRRHFVSSRAMAWVAFDRALRSATEFGLPAPVERWRRVRDAIHAEVCARGFDPALGAFTQAYGSPELDASVLLLAPYGFLPATDPRIQGTVRAIEADVSRGGLVEDGLVKRYREGANVDGLAQAREGAFLPCSFWLVENYALLGRGDDARALFARLTGLAGDLGLLAEEYDTRARRQVGNFPQAFTHAALAAAAWRLSGAG